MSFRHEITMQHKNKWHHAWGESADFQECDCSSGYFAMFYILVFQGPYIL